MELHNVDEGDMVLAHIYFSGEFFFILLFLFFLKKKTIPYLCG
jgi:hypothetical protein